MDERGQVFTKKIKNLLVDSLDLKPYSYDGFSIITYLNGYTNYKYKGSLSLHKAGAKNGFSYMRKHVNESIPLLEKYIVDPFKKQGKLTLPVRESDLTEEARMLHEKNKLLL